MQVALDQGYLEYVTRRAGCFWMLGAHSLEPNCAILSSISSFQVCGLCLEAKSLSSSVSMMPSGDNK